MKSMTAPFQIINGKIADTSDFVKMMEQKIINVLVTNKFERGMIPDFGAGVQQLLFDSIDELVEVDFKTDAAQELVGRVSGLNIVDIHIEQTDESIADITVAYRTLLSGVRTTSFSVAIPGLLNEETPI